jgi:hypothetical protein
MVIAQGIPAADVGEGSMTASNMKGVLGLLAGAALIMQSGPALADTIDGDWCHADGRRLSIAGPDIVTPGGTHVKGDYDRHHFNYVVPASEPGTGETVAMILQGELQMHLKPPAGESQTWRRCSKPIS